MERIRVHDMPGVAFEIVDPACPLHSPTSTHGDADA